MTTFITDSFPSLARGCECNWK